MFLELKPCLATFDIDVFCLNVVWITANVSLSLSKLDAPLDHANPPLSHLISTTGMSDSHSIDNYPHLLSTKYPVTLVASVA
jgi:hypothetical protein